MIVINIFNKMLYLNVNPDRVFFLERIDDNGRRKKRPQDLQVH